MKKLIGKMFMDLDKIATPTARKIFLSENQNSALQRKEEFKFFSSIKLKSGVTKTTDVNRMTEIDNWIYEFLPKDKTLNILDVGISSGITTVELCEFLDSKNISYRVTAIDSDVTAYLLNFPNGKSVLTDKNGNPIHFEIDGKGFGYVKGTNVKHRIERALLKSRSDFFVKFQLKNDWQSVKKADQKNGVKINRVELVCREISENPNIELSEESLFSKEIPGEYDFIRAANILNRGYFSEVQLNEGLQNLKGKLEIDGLLLICRTNMERENNATLFKLTKSNKFEPISRFGKGSEIEDLVVAV